MIECPASRLQLSRYEGRLATRSFREQHPLELFRRALLHMRQDVTVGFERDRDVRVTEALRYDLRVLVGGQQ